MSKLDFYFCPFACSGVSLCALEELGLEYHAHVINIFRDEHKQPDYLKIHPNGKVPALSVNGRVIIENASILLYLHKQVPESNLLPSTDDPIESARQISDLVWCSSGLHPMVRQIRMPVRFTDGETSGIKAKGEAMFHDVMRRFEERLSGERWWYGEHWSIIDRYILWLTTTAGTGGFPLEDYPSVQEHRDRTSAQPSAIRAWAIEIEAADALGMPVPE